MNPLQLTKLRTDQLMNAVLADPTLRRRVFDDLTAQVEQANENIEKVTNELSVKLREELLENIRQTVFESGLIEQVIHMATPEKGVSYYTAEEKQELVNELLDLIVVPKPEFSETDKKTLKKDIKSELKKTLKDELKTELVGTVESEVERQMPVLDEDGIVQRVLEKVPQPEKLNYDELTKKLERKYSVKDIDGLEQTLSAIRNQTRQGYLHGGGITELTAGSNITLVRDSSGNYTISSTGGSSVNFADNETPSGSINGVNTVFTLAQTPSPAASLQLFRNGVLALQGVNYTLSGTTITFITTPPQTNNTLKAFYRYA